MNSMSDLKRWKTVNRRLLIERLPWMRLYEDDVALPDGRIVEGYLRLETPVYVMITPLDDAGQIGLVRSYKRGVDAIDLQPPAGVIDPGEAPLTSAHRELQEELGCRAERLHPLGSFVLSGNYYGGQAHFYLGTGCQVVAEPDSGDLEEQRVEWLPYDQVHEMWVDGQFQQMSVVAALGLALSHIERLCAGGTLTLGETR
jgi:ADP-ribose pyrophosphatase